MTAIDLENGKVYTGAQIKKMCGYYRFYRLTCQNEIHNGFQYETGLNIDTIDFNPSGSCKPGGLYFFDHTQVHNYRLCACDVYWIRKVEIPDDAQVYVEYGKYKADKFILHDRIRIGNVDDTALCEMYDACIDFLKKGYIRFHSDIFETECVNILRKNAYMLLEMRIITGTMKWHAVIQNPQILKHIDDQSEQLCEFAFDVDITSFRYIKKQTEKICLTIVNIDGRNLQYVLDQTEEICLAAVEQNGMALEYVEEQTEAICLAAVKQNGAALVFIKKQTQAICLVAIKNSDQRFIHFVVAEYKKECLDAITNNCGPCNR